MLFVVIGLVLIGLNLADVGPFGRWNWEFFGDLWKFCVPFVLADPLVDLVRQVRPQQAPRDGSGWKTEEGRGARRTSTRSAWTRARRKAQQQRRSQQRSRRGRLDGPAPGAQSPSSTAPRLALDAFFANLASTPRV